MSQQRPGKRKIIVREMKPIVRDGRTRTGSTYSLWQVRATTEGGREIEQNLRTFDDLPLHQVIEVDIEPFQHETWGQAYTVKLPGTAQRPDLQKQVQGLAERVARLEHEVQQRRPVNGATGPPPPPDSPPPPPPAETPVGGSDDDVPF